MNRIQRNQLFHFIWINLIASLLFLSCSQENEDQDPIPAESPAFVSIYHSAPDTDGLFVLLSTGQLSEQPFKYLEYSGYLPFIPGDRNIKFVEASTNVIALIDTTFTLVSDKSYSIFATNTSGNLEAVIFEDILPLREIGKAMVRFVHLSPDAPEVSVLANEDLLFSSTSFKGGTDFIPIDAGRTNLELLNSEKQTLITLLEEFRLISGEYYTFLLLGFDNPPVGNTNGLQFVGIQL